MEEVNTLKFEIVRKIGLLSEGARGWRKELNIVSWNEREPRLDIREWSEDHSRMSKGVTLGRDEAERLCEYLGSYLKQARVAK